MNTTDRDDEDGRHLRRRRNREAVVDALLTLYAEGNLDPSSAEIAERAGSSPRSLFRYFDDVDDLCSEAIRSHEERIGRHVGVGAGPDDPLADRVAALITSRVALYEAAGAVGQVARMRAPFQPLIAAELAQGRTFLRNQIRRLFAAELSSLESASAGELLSALDVATSYESYWLMRNAQGHSRARAAQVLERMLHALLSPAQVH
jgi:AcrR family transcriptional regulator